MPRKKKTEENKAGIPESKDVRDFEVNGMTFSTSSVVVTDDGIYQIDLLPDLEVVDRLDDNVAYLSGDYYYLFRGIGNPDTASSKKPGIYKNKHAYPRFFIVEPETDEEKEQYNSEKNVSSLHPVSIIDSANTKEDLLVAIPESTKIFQPQITEHDDILKLIAKKALLAKNVDLDKYKDRFANKNELFNFKQVIRGDNKLSMRIFNRGIEALNLQYQIILTERTDNDIVGEALKEPIVVSSEETYNL